MSNKVRYVFDTNTIISAVLINNSIPFRAFQYALKNGDILMSPGTLEELAVVFRRKKFDRYVASAKRDEFLEALIYRAIFIEPKENIHECRDTKDNKFLELAVSGEAQIIVSGDNDLLELNPFRDIEIMTPGQLLKAKHSEI